jgi:hypothetical protein
MNAKHKKPGRWRQCLVWTLALLVIVATWWSWSPGYIDLDVPFKPEDSAWGAKSYITVHERAWNGGGTYYVVRLQGFARDRQGWTREAVIGHFDVWLVQHGWERSGQEERGSGVFYDWDDSSNASYFRYHRRGTAEFDDVHVNLTVSFDNNPDAKDAGLRMWHIVLESVNPSWLTSVFRSFD